MVHVYRRSMKFLRDLIKWDKFCIQGHNIPFLGKFLLCQGFKGHLPVNRVDQSKVFSQHFDRDGICHYKINEKFICKYWPPNLIKFFCDMPKKSPKLTTPPKKKYSTLYLLEYLIILKSFPCKLDFSVLDVILFSQF